ncbi:metal ABC transporter permease [Thermus thermamylovorans]|uniref:Metal ABC transporter permease n=1 Tax=Thermus thermamylovorans TaxID=2509362 RepID=A0A4Q9B4E9_9DEIN|nr:metal ABC transporter permease [Thermus thermamylovorans]TBH20672.1 metal ABC transporter permease [Thermus thermamylovorans]
MLEALSFPFFQRALLAGVLVSLLTGLLSPFVVQRRLSFLGDGLAHAAFAGVALGLFLRGEPLWFALPFTFLVAMAITFVKERTELSEDTAIGVFFALSVALGALFLSQARGYVGDAMGYLFGSLLAVGPQDLLAVGLLLLLALFLLPLWGPLAYATFDRELALSDRVPVAFHDYLLSGFIAVSLVLAVKVVGIILVAAFLVIPGATARLLAPTMALLTLLSLLLAALSTVLGLFLSFLLDWPSGASIVLFQAFLFGLAFVKTVFSGGK